MREMSHYQINRTFTSLPEDEYYLIMKGGTELKYLKLISGRVGSRKIYLSILTKYERVTLFIR